MAQARCDAICAGQSARAMWASSCSSTARRRSGGHWSAPSREQNDGPEPATGHRRPRLAEQQANGGAERLSSWARLVASSGSGPTVREELRRVSRRTPASPIRDGNRVSTAPASQHATDPRLAREWIAPRPPVLGKAEGRATRFWVRANRRVARTRTQLSLHLPQS